ncbi:hypothetical protein K443DRAFT_8419 [Laccaria amethystina LaAM-08-1]|uniref:Uncharacterized protein n=1 Tax=Laccaria amethystina LaAM-08-1 TaxID=1095629 RepID=A0A0C9XD71_9AGAR|nr:hypothetical protein K443DRAFT_8419 [Laccaria amethystina LaAM-08-1]
MPLYNFQSKRTRRPRKFFVIGLLFLPTLNLGFSQYAGAVTPEPLIQWFQSQRLRILHPKEESLAGVVDGHRAEAICTQPHCNSSWLIHHALVASASELSRAPATQAKSTSVTAWEPPAKRPAATGNTNERQLQHSSRSRATAPAFSTLASSSSSSCISVPRADWTADKTQGSGAETQRALILLIPYGPKQTTLRDEGLEGYYLPAIRISPHVFPKLIQTLTEFHLAVEITITAKPDEVGYEITLDNLWKTASKVKHPERNLTILCYTSPVSLLGPPSAKEEEEQHSVTSTASSKAYTHPIATSSSFNSQTRSGKRSSDDDDEANGAAEHVPMYSPPSTPSTPSEPSMYLLPSASTLQATPSQPSNPSTSTNSETDHPQRHSACIASHPPPVIDVDDSDDDVAPQQPVNLVQPIRNQSAFMWQSNLTRMMRSPHPDALDTDAININALTERDAAQALIQCLISHFLNNPLSADTYAAPMLCSAVPC